MRSTVALALCAALSPALHAYPPTITTGVVGVVNPVYTWTVTTDNVNSPIASVHITGPTVGGTPTSNPPPAGWVFTGNAGTGDYSWERSNNATGTFAFGITFDQPLAQSVGSWSYDTFSGATRNAPVDVPVGPTGTGADSAIVPIPEPASAALFLGAAVLALSRPKRRCSW